MPYTGAVGSQLQHLGSMGVQCLAQGHLSHDKELPPLQLSPIFFLSGEWGSNHQPSGYWTTTLTTEPQLPFESMCIRILKKHFKIQFVLSFFIILVSKKSMASPSALYFSLIDGSWLFNVSINVAKSSLEYVQTPQMSSRYLRY